MKQTENYSPWQNAAESGVCELKHGAGRKLAKTKSPASLWDHCMELEVYIRSHTPIDSYELQGQVPEMVLSGQTADISPFAEYGWYDWVKYWDTLAPFPDAKEVYGRWLSPAMDIGPAMTSKVLKQNGQVLYTSTLRPMKPNKLNDPGEIKQWKEFDEAIKLKLGNPMSDQTLKELGIETPEHERYADEYEDSTPIPDIDDVTPEEANNYVGATVNLPVGGIMQAGRVRKRTQGDDGEVIGTLNENPLLDNQSYQVKFDDGVNENR